MTAQLPAKWVAGAALPQGTSITGTVWSGQVIGMPPNGQTQFKTHPKNIFGSQPLATFEGRAPGITLRGGARPGLISDVKIFGNVDTFSNVDTRLSGLVGDFDVSVDALEFSDVCEQASGTVSTNVLASNERLWSWRGPVMSGPITCEAGDLVLALTGKDRQAEITSHIRISASGAYTVNVNLTTRQLQADAVLPLYGFAKTAQGYSLTETGQWR